MPRMAPPQQRSSSRLDWKESQSGLQQQRSSSLIEFDELLAPLERASGRRLAGRGRENCFRAYQRSPELFAALVADAAARARWSPLGFLCRLVEDGDHLEAARAALALAENGVDHPQRQEPCPECGTGGGRHVADCSRRNGDDRDEDPQP